MAGHCGTRLRPQSVSPARITAFNWSRTLPGRLRRRICAVRDAEVITAHARAAAP